MKASPLFRLNRNDSDSVIVTLDADDALIGEGVLDRLAEAERPVHISEPLYLYEPSGVGKATNREAREAIIARIVAKPPARREGGGR